ncbi:MAG: hypothetical protein ABSB50_12280 [Terracidiphilus sp.]
MTSFTSAPQFSQIRAGRRWGFRIDIRHSLQMHQRLAVGLALIGVLLGAIYVLNCISIQMAPSEVTTPPSLSAGQPQTNSIGGGIAELAAAAVDPWYAANLGVFRDAIVLLIGFIVLGAGIAVVAHKADSRVYIASDVERLLGFEPIAVLPDFSEVADEVAEEKFLRLASGIDRAFTARNLTSCVFTAAGPGAGVTTVATRVKEMLERLGRAAVIVDDADVPFFAARRGEQTTAMQGDGMVAPLSVADSTAGPGVIFLADAEPLTNSIEAEKMVRSADCAIVVIESGVTTRAQVREAANALQRIKAPVAGFVLNRVRMAKADPEFKRSIKEAEQDLHKKGQFTDRQMFRTLRQAVEQGRAGLNLDTAIASEPAGAAAEFPREEKIAQIDAKKSGNQARPTPPAGPKELRCAPDSVTAGSELETREQKTPQPTANGGRSGGSESDATGQAPVEHSCVSLPRLSELRGNNFTQALKALDMTKHPEPASTNVEDLLVAIAPFEQAFMGSGPFQSGAMMAGAQAEQTPAEAMQTFVPIPFSGSAFQKGIREDSSENGARNGNSQPETLPLRPVIPESSKARREGSPARNTRGRNDSESKRDGASDQVHILPSQRGQYKRKD